MTRSALRGERVAMLRASHENVATVLVDPAVQGELEIHLMSLDLWFWPVATAPVSVDGPRQAFQIRRRMIAARRGEWDDAADWVAAWISFGESWRHGPEPIPWPARKVLYGVLEQYAASVRYRRGLGGIAPLDVPHERSA